MSALGTKRCVYVLSIDLVERIQAYAASLGLAEVAAVKRLLRDALNAAETGQALEARLRRSCGGIREKIMDEVYDHQGVRAIDDINTPSPLILCRDGHEFRPLSNGDAA